MRARFHPFTARPKGEDHLETRESFIAYDPAQRAYTLVGSTGHANHVLTAGDVLALAISGQYQQVRVAHGGYRGWYFVTARGRRGRFALTETTSPPRLLTDKQVMDWLEISRTGLHYLMRRKGFPYVKLGESRRAPLRFSQQSVQEWLAQNEHRITA